MRLLFIFALLFALAANASDVQQQKFFSKNLDRDYPFTIYLPDGYRESNLRYPVLYLLHGSVGSEKQWVELGNIQPTTDTLIGQKKIPPMLIVMPGHSQSWWADGNDEPAETVLLKELFPYVEKNFRTITERAGRAVAGLSAGGFATVNLTLRFPELFAVGAALSPAIYQDLPPKSSSAYRHKVFQVNGEFDPAIWRRLNWPSFIDDYEKKNIIVPLYINSGDHDRLEIAYQAAFFYQRMRQYQPKQLEFRVVDGDHEWDVWAGTIGDALEFIGAHIAPPK